MEKARTNNLINLLLLLLAGVGLSYLGEIDSRFDLLIGILVFLDLAYFLIRRFGGAKLQSAHEVERKAELLKAFGDFSYMQIGILAIGLPTILILIAFVFIN